MAQTNSSMTTFLLHLHPKRINSQALKYTRTFGLGGINALLFTLLTLSGLILRFAYVPTPAQAYDSIVALQNNSIFGSLLRNIHHWSGMLLIITTFLHLLRVFYSQSIFYERKKTWYSGLYLFSIVLGFNFTGYLLPWDQLSFWAVTIMTNIISYIPILGHGTAHIIRGGEIVNAHTLLNFYNLHTAIFPLLFVGFMVLHFWQIRKAKGVTVSNIQEQKMVPVNPGLIQKEIITGLSLIAVVLVFSMLFSAPLLEKANPLVSPNPSKSPWYFMGIQELLIHLHPFIATVIIPFFILLFFIMIPRTKLNQTKVGQWFYSPMGKKIVLASVGFAFIFTLFLIYVFEHYLHLNQLAIPQYISTGIIPLLLYLIPTSAFVLYIKTKLKADRAELILAVASIIFTAYLTMSIIGVWFRGESMHLIF